MRNLAFGYFITFCLLFMLILGIELVIEPRHSSKAIIKGYSTEQSKIIEGDSCKECIIVKLNGQIDTIWIFSSERWDIGDTIILKSK